MLVFWYYGILVVWFSMGVGDFDDFDDLMI
jgi:hypothetical protein